jgi:Tol biopolymer transport system component
VSTSGATVPLRRVPLGPSPSFGFPVDSASAVVITRTPRNYRRVSITGSDTGLVLLDVTPGHSAIPVLSADGQWMAVRANATVTNNQQSNVIHLIRTDGSARTTVEIPFFAAPTSNNPLLLPGGREMIVVENRSPDPGVYLVNATTRATQKLFSYSPQFSFPEIALSPIDRSLLYIVSETLPLTLSVIDVSRPRAR